MDWHFTADAERLERIYAKISRRIVPPMLIGYIVAYLDRVNVGFAKLQMLEHLQFSETVYGFGAGVFFLGYFFFELPSNMILHRVGARVWITRIMITWGTISAAMMFVTTPTAFYCLRFLLGAAEAGFFPGVIFYFTQWYPAARRGRITTLFMTGVPVSSVIGGLVSGWIMEMSDGVNGWAGWQWLFILEGLPGILLGIYIYFRLTDNIEKASWLTASERQLLVEDFASDRTEQSVHSFTRAVRDRRVWFACLIYFCLVVGLYAIGFWLPTIISDMGVRSPLMIGLLSAIPYTAAAIGMVLVGWSADYHRERRWHVAVPAAIGATFLVLSVLLAAHPILAIGALAVATFGILTGPPLFWELPTAYLRGAAAAAGIAVINSFGNLAGFVSPYMIGRIKDVTGSSQAGMYIAAIIVLIGAGLVLTTRPSQLAHR